MVRPDGTAQVVAALDAADLLDPVTGLPGRRAFLRVLDHPPARPLAVLAFDLDRFGLVNALRGREEGDRVLRTAGHALLDAVADHGVVARIGGDQFGVLLYDSAAEAHREALIAEAGRLTAAVARSGAATAEPAGRTACVGLAAVRPGHPAHASFDEAMTALRRAKDRGPSAVVAYDEETFRASMRRYLVEHHLGQAVQRNELSLRFQPEIDLRTGTVVGAEALVRWRHRRLGDVSPADFIPVAETTNMILPIGAWVVEAAARQWAAWRAAQGGQPKIWVNLSGAQLADADALVHQVVRVLDDHGVPPSAFGVEVTETALLADLAASRRALGRLRDRGIGVAVDDFGSGYSSFTYLRYLPATRLKIDRALVTGVGGSREDTSIVEAVIDLGHTLDLEVVAEGVETEAQAAALMRLGADSAQGFLFAPALEPEPFATRRRHPWAGAPLSAGTLATPRPAVLPGVARGRGTLLVATLDAAPDAVLLVDAERTVPTIVYANRRAEAITGLAWHQLAGCAVATVLPGEDVARAVASRDAAVAEVVHAHPRLGTRVLEVRLGAPPGGPGASGHRMAVLRDVTEARVAARQQAADGELVQRATALGERLAGGDPLRGEAVRAAVAATGALLGAVEAHLEVPGSVPATAWRRPGVATAAGTVLGVPVHVPGRAAGRLTLRRADQRAWRPAEVAAARLAADGIGLAVAGAEPVIDLRRQAAFDGFRHRVSRQGLPGDGPRAREGFSAACRELAGLLGAAAAWVELVDPERGVAEPLGSWPPAPTGPGSSAPAAAAPGAAPAAGVDASSAPVPVATTVALRATVRRGLLAAAAAGTSVLAWDGAGPAPDWVEELAGPAAVHPPAAALVAPLQAGGRLVGALSVVTATPRPWPVEDTTLLADVAGTLAGAVAHVRHERQLRVAEERFRMLAEHASDMISLADADGVLQYVSRASAALLGRPPESLLGARLVEVVHPEDLAAVQEAFRRSAAERSVCRCLARFVRVDGGHVWVETMLQPQVEPDGRVRGWHTTSRDVTERRRVEEELARLALHDGLTRLPNRMLLLEHVQAAIDRLGRDGVPFAVVAVDLDGFKAVNDGMGHQAGDQVLQIVAKRLEKLMRATDVVARVSGDEFVVLCADTDVDGAALVASRIVQKVSEPFSLDGGTAVIGASCGVAPGEQGITRDELLRRADLAMYRAKHAGKGRIARWAGPA